MEPLVSLFSPTLHSADRRFCLKQKSDHHSTLRALCFLHPLQNEIQPLTWLVGHFLAGPLTASPASYLWKPWVLISSWLAQLHVGPRAWDPHLPVLTLLSPQTSPSLWSPLFHPRENCLCSDNTPILIPTASGAPPGQGSVPLSLQSALSHKVPHTVPVNVS